MDHGKEENRKIEMVEPKESKKRDSPIYIWRQLRDKRID